MNSHQKIVNARISRTFTRGDGVIFNGKEGVIQSCHEQNNEYHYMVEFDNELTSCKQSELISHPKGNIGKYGSKKSGYTGGNGYRS